MAEVNLQNFVLKEAYDIYGFVPSTGLLRFMLEDNQDVAFNNSVTTTYINGKNNVRLAAYDNDKMARIEGSSGLISIGLWGSQMGSEIQNIASTTDVMRREVIKKDIDGKFFTEFVGTGLAGMELKYIYIRNNVKDPGIAYPQGATASATEFSYSPTTKEIVLPTSITDVPETIPNEIVTYYYPELTNVIRMENMADKSSETLDIVMNTLVRDICNVVDYRAQVRMRAKVDGNMNMATGGEGATHQFAFESILGCEGNKLWVHDIYLDANFVA